jgi:hypothetical protein
MISVDLKDSAGNVVGTGQRYTNEELAALPPPEQIDLPVSLDDRIAALEMLALKGAPDLPTAQQVVKDAKNILPSPVVPVKVDT